MRTPRRAAFAAVLSMLLSGFATAPAASPAEKTAKVQSLWSVKTFGTDDYFEAPSDLECDSARSRVYVADTGSHRVLVFDLQGRFVQAIGRQGKGPGEFSRPTGLCVLADGGIAVADYDNNRIQVFDAAGKLRREIPLPVDRVADLVPDGDRFYAVPDHGNSGYQVRMAGDAGARPLAGVVGPDGRMVKTLVGEPIVEKEPFLKAIKHRVCLTRASDGTVYIAHWASNRIHVFDREDRHVADWTPPLPFDPGEPKMVRKQEVETGVIQMAAMLDFVYREARVGPDDRLYLLATLESDARARGRGDKSPSLATGIRVLDRATGGLVRAIPCPNGTTTFALIDAERVVCVHEDDAGELAMTCFRVDGSIPAR